jgi:hypothetical protein
MEGTQSCKPLTHNAYKNKTMHTLTCTSTFGNFKWTAQAQITDEQAVILAEKGLLQIIQRSPASEAEKVLGNYEKRPTDFVRSSIPFSEDNAETLAKFLGAEIELGEGVVIKPSVSVIEHEIGAASQPKFVEEKQIVERHAKAGDLVAWATDKVGFTGEGDLDVENVEFLKAVKAYKAAILANS